MIKQGDIKVNKDESINIYVNDKDFINIQKNGVIEMKVTDMIVKTGCCRYDTKIKYSFDVKPFNDDLYQLSLLADGNIFLSFLFNDISFQKLNEDIRFDLVSLHKNISRELFHGNYRFTFHQYSGDPVRETYVATIKPADIDGYFILETYINPIAVKLSITDHRYPDHLYIDAIIQKCYELMKK